MAPLLLKSGCLPLSLCVLVCRDFPLVSTVYRRFLVPTSTKSCSFLPPFFFNFKVLLLEAREKKSFPSPTFSNKLRRVTMLSPSNLQPTKTAQDRDLERLLSSWVPESPDSPFGFSDSHSEVGTEASNASPVALRALTPAETPTMETPPQSSGAQAASSEGLASASSPPLSPPARLSTELRDIWRKHLSPAEQVQDLFFHHTPGGQSFAPPVSQRPHGTYGSLHRTPLRQKSENAQLNGSPQSSSPHAAISPLKSPLKSPVKKGLGLSPIRQ